MVQKEGGDPYLTRVKRRDFVRLLAARMNITAKEVSLFIDAFANEIASLNADGKCIDIWGFGKFDLVWWGADKVNNLKSSAPVEGRYVPTFRPSIPFRLIMRDSMVSSTRRRAEAESPVEKKVKLIKRKPKSVSAVEAP